jgi:hypothetical protein
MLTHILFAPQALFTNAESSRGALQTGLQSVATALTTTAQAAAAATAAAIDSLSSTVTMRDNCPAGQRWNYTTSACAPQVVQLASTAGMACNSNTAGMIMMDNGQLVQCKPGGTAFTPVSMHACIAFAPTIFSSFTACAAVRCCMNHVDHLLFIHRMRCRALLYESRRPSSLHSPHALPCAVV